MPTSASFGPAAVIRKALQNANDKCSVSPPLCYEGTASRPSSVRIPGDDEENAEPQPPRPVNQPLYLNKLFVFMFDVLWPTR